MATKKIQPAQVTTTWGKTLTKQELLALLDRLEQKKKEREMNKMAETLARALEKKQGKTHVDGSDVAATDTKTKKVKTAPPTGKKPPTRSAGRGR
jgi:putative sterol carrier protein